MAALLCAALRATSQESADRTGAAASAPAVERFGVFVRQIDDMGAPSATAFSPAGELVVLDTVANRVLVFGRDGRWLRVFCPISEEPTTSQPIRQPTWGDATGRFNQPGGIAISPNGWVFIADTNNHRIQAFDSNGEPIVAFGQRGAGPEELDQPTGLAATANRLYVADTGNHRVQAYDHSGQRQLTLGGFGYAKGEMIFPRGVAVDSAGNLYVADSGNHRIQKFNAEGTPILVFGERGFQPGLLAEPTGIAVHGERLFVADSLNHRIQVFDLEGHRQYEWGLHVQLPHEGAGKLHYPDSITVSPDGKLAVVGESYENRLQLFEALPPNPSPIADWNRPDPEPGSHFSPRATAHGRLLFLTVPESCEIQVYDQTRPKPILLSTFGGFGHTPGRFLAPAGLGFDPEKRWLYVCDPSSQRIQILEVGYPSQPLRFEPRLVRLVAAIELGVTSRSPTAGTVEPVALAQMPTGDWLVLDARGRRLLRVDAKCQVQESFDQFDPPLNTPMDVALSGSWWTWVYVSDAGARRVRAFAIDSDRRWREMPGAACNTTSDWLLPFGVACRSDGSLLVSDAGADCIRAFAPRGGEWLQTWGEPGLEARQFNGPHDLVVDDNGWITVMDFRNHRAQTLTTDGQFLRVFGGRWYCEPAESPAATKPAWPPPGWVVPEEPPRPKPLPGTRRGPTGPAASQPLEFRGASPFGSYEVALRPETPPIPVQREFDVLVSVRDTKQQMPVGSEVQLSVDVVMPDHGHGMTVIPRVEPLGRGRFQVRGLKLHMPGYWEFCIDVSANGITERVTLPLEVD